MIDFRGSRKLEIRLFDLGWQGDYESAAGSCFAIDCRGRLRSAVTRRRVPRVHMCWNFGMCQNFDTWTEGSEVPICYVTLEERAERRAWRGVWKRWGDCERKYKLFCVILKANKRRVWLWHVAGHVRRYVRDCLLDKRDPSVPAS